jgi:hypothetical protein
VQLVQLVQLAQLARKELLVLQVQLACKEPKVTLGLKVK